MPNQPIKPIVILGGFLSPGSIYQEMQRSLAELSGQPVHVVNTQVTDWLPFILDSITRLGWLPVLDKLDRTVKKALRDLPGGKVTLVGHSQGGVMARLYLSPETFLGRNYRGLESVSHLVSLGSPHLNHGGVRRGGPISRRVQALVPDAAYADQVRYICVAGKAILGDPQGTPQQRWSASTYRQISGQELAWGDGIVPVQSALLPGSQHLILEGVSHYAIFGEPWYGSPQALPLWWEAVS
jgi:pimeloyl-ACP methyl ester carboxylesterase